MTRDVGRRQHLLIEAVWLYFDVKDVTDETYPWMNIGALKTQKLGCGNRQKLAILPRHGQISSSVKVRAVELRL